ncbi:MAG: hypothetical protein ACE5PM_06115 [Candidatus Hydrothermarchaeales archaeon]
MSSRGSPVKDLEDGKLEPLNYLDSKIEGVIDFTVTTNPAVELPRGIGEEVEVD